MEEEGNDIQIVNFMKNIKLAENENDNNKQNEQFLKPNQNTVKKFNRKSERNFDNEIKFNSSQNDT